MSDPWVFMACGVFVGRTTAVLVGGKLESGWGAKVKGSPPAPPPPPIVHPEVRNQALAVVAADPGPRGDVRILPQRRPAPGAAVAVRRPQLTQRSPRMHPPAVVELAVDVGIECPLLWHPARRPVLPPVEVPARALVQPGWVVEAETEPVVPALLVGAEQEPEVVDLESRGAAQIARFEVGELPGDLAEVNFLGVPCERGAGGIEGQPRIGALIEMHGVALGGGDRLTRAGHAAHVERGGDLVGGLV